jgi:DsbC/DsbD-like thiol-disulfide interchange protein
MSTSGLICSVCASLVIAAAAIAGVPDEAAVKVDLASPWVVLPNARVRLIAGPSAVGTANSYLAGVQLVLADGWKTYWRMPGDAGVPPSFDWAGSRNVASLAVLYPAPTRLIEPAATSIGYKGSVTFPVDVVARDAGAPVVLSLAMELGICRDICIPAEAKLSLAITPAEVRGAPSAPLLAALERVPRAASQRRAGDPEVTRVTTSLEGRAPHLLVEARFPRGVAGADLFLEAGSAEDIYLPPPQRLPDAADGTVRFEVDLSHAGKAQALKGKVLRLTLISDAAASDVAWTIP